MDARHLSAMLGGVALVGSTTVPAIVEERAHLDRIEIALCDVLADDDVWPSFVGSRVYRGADVDVTPDLPRPHFVTWATRADFEDRLSGETKQGALARVSLHYDEPRVILTADDRSSRAFAMYLWQSLIRDDQKAHLNVARWGRPLVPQPPTLRAINFVDVAEGKPTEDGEPTSHREVELELGYVYSLDRRSGQPQGFSAEE